MHYYLFHLVDVLYWKSEKILFWKGGRILECEAREEALLHDKMALEGTLLERILRMAGLFVKEK